VLLLYFVLQIQNALNFVEVKHKLLYWNWW